MTTGTSYVAALSNVNANLFSDLVGAPHGAGLADGVSQGGAGPDRIPHGAACGAWASGCSSCTMEELPI